MTNLYILAFPDRHGCMIQVAKSKEDALKTFKEDPGLKKYLDARGPVLYDQEIFTQDQILIRFITEWPIDTMVNVGSCDLMGIMIKDTTIDPRIQ